MVRCVYYTNFKLKSSRCIQHVIFNTLAIQIIAALFDWSNSKTNPANFQVASRSLHSHKPRALPCHTPYLRATQTLRLRCRGVGCVRYARTRFLLLPNDSKPCRNPVGSKRSLVHSPTKSVISKAVWKIIFRRPLSIESSLHFQKLKCRLLFVMIGKNSYYFYTVYCSGTK